MYFLVVIFHIRATSSPLSALMFMIQIVVYTIRLNVSLHMCIENRVTYMALKILKVLCSIWSLDIFCCCSTILCGQQHQSWCLQKPHLESIFHQVSFYFLLSLFLLILYPTTLFRRCVTGCGFWRWHALHMFVGSFQGWYRNGTNGTHDFRMVSASFLILRILILALFLNHHRSSSSTLILQDAFFAGASRIHSITKPYKLNLMNNVDIVILFCLRC